MTISEISKLLHVTSPTITQLINGKNHELLEVCEVYREIVSSQLSEEEIA